jgi:cytochrome c biogenesis protein CcdA
MAIVGVLISLLGRFVLSTLLEADVLSRVALSALVYGGLGIISIFIGLRSLGVNSIPGIPGLQAVNQLFSTRAGNVQGFDRRMFAFGALYGGGMAAGCPVPTYWALLFWVAINANPIFGALVLGVHALGYAAPVLAVGILSRMGISVIKSVPKRGQRLQMLVSAGMLTAGVYLVVIYIVIRLSILVL